MTARITKPIRGGVVRAISSKSAAHRLMICAALAVGEAVIDCSDRSDDIEATSRCLEAIKAGECELDCGESGSTLRFLLPVCGALGKKVIFKMSGRLPSRPMSALIDAMTAHGCFISGSLMCEGQLTGGEYILPGDVSSQFVSGLLFALPLLPEESYIRVTGTLESRPYVEMTLDALRLFGITIIVENQCFRIPGGQVYCSPGRVSVEGDWSNAAFWLAAGAIGRVPVEVTGLDPNSRQGDKAIADLLARFGAPGDLKGITIDAGNTPDLVPALAAVASVAKGRTIIYNIGRLRLKESDRLKSITASFSSLGADITETRDSIIIYGKQSLPGGATESFGDHRIAMAAAILSSACDGPVIIRGAEAVTKSYPRFFDDFIALGGAYECLTHTDNI
jgi:3-phosphoshikimate 1-carboxyvinyltransferase